jgi:hypothetical protein
MFRPTTPSVLLFQFDIEGDVRGATMPFLGLVADCLHCILQRNPTRP